MGVPGQFGPAVIGKAQYEKEQKIVKDRSDKYGLGVLATEGPVNVAAVAVEAAADISLKTLAERLTANAALVDTLFQSETARPRGPREKALELLDEAAQHMKRDDLHEKIVALQKSGKAVGEPPESKGEQQSEKEKAKSSKAKKK